MQKSQTNPPMTFILDGFLGTIRGGRRLQRLIDSTSGPCCIWHYEHVRAHLARNVGAGTPRRDGEMRRSINLVGYSMGGMSPAKAARTTGRDINRAVFLHSPHNGPFSRTFFPVWPHAARMRPAAIFLARLDAAAWNTPTLATWLCVGMPSLCLASRHAGCAPSTTLPKPCASACLALFFPLRSMPPVVGFLGEMREADCCRVPAAAGSEEKSAEKKSATVPRPRDRRYSTARLLWSGDFPPLRKVEDFLGTSQRGRV